MTSKKHKQKTPIITPKKPRRISLKIIIGTLMLLGVFGIAYGVTTRTEKALPFTATVSLHCSGALTQDFQCFRKRFEAITRHYGPTVALADLKQLYAHNTYVVSQCHQFTHVIGNTASELYPEIGDAFRFGDGICWSGYYHGVVEQAAKRFSVDTIKARTNDLCAQIPGKERYSFDYYNCVHGLGHGFMAITKNELFDSLHLCDNLTGRWEQESCYGGAFMENVMADNRNHQTKYLKPDDLLYPCTAVEETYKGQCYLMQTSYALTKNGHDFANLFALCARAETNYQDICAQSIGRDASGQSVSQVEQTRSWCALAQNPIQERNCVIGAVKDFISYYHGNTEAEKLCNAFPEDLAVTCRQTMVSYMQTL
jgi:hypothetical protein